MSRRSDEISPTTGRFTGDIRQFQNGHSMMFAAGTQAITQMTGRPSRGKKSHAPGHAKNRRRRDAKNTTVRRR